MQTTFDPWQQNLIHDDKIWHLDLVLGKKKYEYNLVQNCYATLRMIALVTQNTSQNTTLNNGTLTSSSTGYSATDHFSSNLLSSRHLKLDLDTNFLSHCSSDFHFFKIGNPILEKSQVPRSSGCPVRVYTKSGSPFQPGFLPKKNQELPDASLRPAS